MANVSAYSEKKLLDIILGSSVGIGLSLGAPTSVSASEIATGSGWTRQSVSFAAAASPAGTATNNLAVTFGTGLTAAVFSGLQLWDNTISGSGSMLWYGTLATPRTVGVGDEVKFSVAALTISLS